MHNEYICSICIENIDLNKQNIKYIKFVCSHIYHTECVNPWVIKKNSCPNCRTIIKKDIKNEDIENTNKSIYRYNNKSIYRYNNKSIYRYKK